MPFLGLGLHLGDADADSIVGWGGPVIDGVIQTEAEDFLLVEAGQFLAFD
jgi:hypothetical protein